MTEHPGSFSTFFSLLAIFAYVIGGFTSLSIFDIIFTSPSTFEEGLGLFIGSIILLAFCLGLALIGSVFAIFGQVWRQKRVIAGLSFAAFLFCISSVVYIVAVYTTSFDVSLLGLLAAILLITVLHIIGIFRK